MKNFFTGLMFMMSLASFQFGCAQAVLQNTTDQKAVAIVLKFSGKNGIPEQMEVDSKITFTGNVKNLETGDVLEYTEPYRLKFFNESGEMLYTAEIQNPLKQSMESGNTDNTMERTDVENKTGYVNARFKINENVKTIKAVCYKINGAEEIEITTFKTDIQ